MSRRCGVDPNNLRIYARLGAALVDAYMMKEAAKCCRDALRIDSHFVPALMNAGLMYRRSGRPAKAIKCYNKAI